MQKGERVAAAWRERCQRVIIRSVKRQLTLKHAATSSHQMLCTPVLKNTASHTSTQ